MINKSLDLFERRHIGINKTEEASMLDRIGVSSMDELIKLTIPDHIMIKRPMDIPEAVSEQDYLTELSTIAEKNELFTNYIGQGYYGTITPSVILRNVFHNPGWYTQYTPYQAEIAQGRLEALLNFQTMVADLTAMPVANASLLDEATAAAEAMAMFYDIRNKKRKKDPATKFFVDKGVYQQTLGVLATRSSPLEIEIVIGDYKTAQLDDSYIGALLQYPNASGQAEDLSTFVATCKANDQLVCVAADLMSLALLTPPGEWGVDAVVGTTQRFGVPMGYGGPHAAYFATLDAYKRMIPGRIIGVSQDRSGAPALRMALQTREQHIKREKATSNICTAQALLAVMASMYAVYHGPEGIKHIAATILQKANSLRENLRGTGLTVTDGQLFDTIEVTLSKDEQASVKAGLLASGINIFYTADGIRISVDESHTIADLDTLVSTIAKAVDKTATYVAYETTIAPALQRASAFMEHEVFSSYHTESKMMRYIKSLENKDLSLVHSMIALGSCTMKLNAATQLIPVSWPKFSKLHPFTPVEQTAGYQQIFNELSHYLAEATGFTACSLQPNSGAQGEYAGLMTISAYHHHRGEGHRNIALIPSSAHGTNPASAVMAGMKVVVIKCDEAGNIDVDHLMTKIEEYKDSLAALMVTYPSTHGVFETAITEICQAVHDAGGMVYMDGANMNAQVGLTSPGMIGADVCHLNLHKTFAIPHGGGGPGMGPICCNDKLAPFLPGHSVIDNGHNPDIHAVSAAPWGSASILLISYAYIRLLGREGLTNSTKYAILNANYIKARLDGHYSVLYIGEKGMAAHEMIIDLRQYKPLQIQAEDVAKRLIDYGFHAPTLSFPVAGTIMIEPTESEDLDELDRFCDAMIGIKKEIDMIATGELDAEDNPLRNAPHTCTQITADDWPHAYTRQQASYPLPYLYEGKKFWPTVQRVNNAYGDRNLICTCPPIESYSEDTPAT
jgi:glycine dehydrogenase